MVMMTLSSQYNSWLKHSPHPDERTSKYGPPLDAIWFITFRRPERMMTQNGRLTSILGQDMFSPIKKRPTVKKIKMF